MSIFQKAYDAIKSWQAPQWLRKILQDLNDLMISILRETGEAYISYLKEQIIIASKEDWTPEEKFRYVFKQAKTSFVTFAVRLKDNELNSLINSLVSLLKCQGAI